MASPRQLSRSLLARLIARVLIAALLFSLVPPPRAEASIPSAPLTAPGPTDHLPPATAKEGRFVVVVVVVVNPIWLTKSAFGELLSRTGSDPQPYTFG